jgi:TRAP-type mannitol/chloroaromatic compound transport system permease small subunit
LKALLSISRLIDAVNSAVGRTVYWLILVAVVVSAGNATMRYVFNIASNSWLELQWYLFSAVFLLCAGYTYLHKAHVRIDLVAGRFSFRTQAWVDVVGIVMFLLPPCVLIFWYGWDAFVSSWIENEQSTDAGGLTRWPVKLLIPVGFGLLIAQAISELIKRIAFLKGMIDWSPPGHQTEEPASAGGQ